MFLENIGKTLSEIFGGKKKPQQPTPQPIQPQPSLTGNIFNIPGIQQPQIQQPRIVQPQIQQPQIQQPQIQQPRISPPLLTSIPTSRPIVPDTSQLVQKYGDPRPIPMRVPGTLPTPEDYQKYNPKLTNQILNQKQIDINKKIADATQQINTATDIFEKVTVVPRATAGGISKTALGLTADIPGLIFNFADSVTDDKTAFGQAINDISKNIYKFKTDVINKNIDNFFTTPRDSELVKTVFGSAGELLFDIGTGKVVLKTALSKPTWVNSATAVTALKTGEGLTDAGKVLSVADRIKKANTIATSVPAFRQGMVIYNQNFQDAKDAGKSDFEAATIATASSGLQAITEKLGMDKLLNPGAGNVLNRFIKRGISEGLQESIQQVISNVYEGIYNPNRDVFDGVAESAVLGGFLGSSAGVGLDITEGKLNPKNTVNKIKEYTNTVNQQLQTIGSKARFTANQIQDYINTTVLQNKPGFIKIPGGEKFTEQQYRDELKQRIANEMEYWNNNDGQLRTSYKKYGSLSSPTNPYNVTKKLFKEYIKNPDLFIDNYKLLPDTLSTGSNAPQQNDPIVNQKTGETLSQAVAKLKQQGWSQKDISKYSDAVLNPKQAIQQAPEQSEQSDKEKQLNIINKSNPAQDNIHTWIRKVEDIHTLKEALDLPDYTGYDDFMPDYTKKMADEAIKSGKIEVFSSYPIKNGIFVTPSKMEAQSYSGNGKVYSKIINIKDVAWIDPTQGQVAKLTIPQQSSKPKVSAKDKEKIIKRLEQLRGAKVGTEPSKRIVVKEEAAGPVTKEQIAERDSFIATRLKELGFNTNDINKFQKLGATRTMLFDILKSKNIDKIESISGRVGYMVNAIKKKVANTPRTTEAAMKGPTSWESRKSKLKVSKKAAPEATQEPIEPKPKPTTKKIVKPATEPVVSPQTQSLDSLVKSLPSSDKATPNDISKISDVKNELIKELNKINSSLTEEEKSRWIQEIVKSIRDPEYEVPARYKELQQKIQPMLDAMLDAYAGEIGVKKSKDGYYFYEQALINQDENTQVGFGDTFINQVNQKAGFKLKNNRKIAIEDLGDSVTAIKNYVEQYFYDQYGHLKRVEELNKAGYKNAEEYIKTEEVIVEDFSNEISDQLNNIIVDETGKKKKKKVKVKKPKEPDIVQKLQDNFTKNGNPDEIYENSSRLPGAASIRTTRKLWDRVSDGNSSVYQKSGMRDYDEANGVGSQTYNQIVEETKDNPSFGAFADKAVEIYGKVWEQEFKGIMPYETFITIVYKRAKKAYYNKSELPFNNLERELAAEKLRHYIERVRFTNPAVANRFMKEANYILKDGRNMGGIAQAITNRLTQMYHAAALGLNPRSAIQQITEISRVAGITSNKQLIRALYDSVRSMKPKEVEAFLKSYGLSDDYTSYMLQNSDSNAANRMDDVSPRSKKISIGQAYDWVAHATMKGFNAFEAAKDITLLKALEIKYEHLQGREKYKAILKEFNQYSLKGGHYGSIDITNRSNIARLGLQFGQYSMKDWGLLAEKADIALHSKGKEREDAIKYIAKTLGVKTALAIPLYLLFGSTLLATLGFNEYKGGPLISVILLFFSELQKEDERARTATEMGKENSDFNFENVMNAVSKKQTPLLVPGGNYLFNKLGIQDLTQEGRDIKWIRHDTVFGDLYRGYNMASDGRARFGVDVEDPWQIFKSVIGGAYNTKKAQEYFNNHFLDVDFYGTKLNQDSTFVPASQAYQGLIDNIAADKTLTTRERNIKINDILDKSRAAYAERQSYFMPTKEEEKTPAGKQKKELKALWDELYRAEWNPQTQKYESDLISPDKWKKIAANQDGMMFKFMKDRAKRNYEDFGIPIDPIYLLEDKKQINTILQLRSMFTGDDREAKAILRLQPWYVDYTNSMDKYGKAQQTMSPSISEDYGKTKRAEEYIQLSKQNPRYSYKLSDTLKTYENLRDSGKLEEAKAFYKENLDALSAEYAALDNLSYEWTNKMRKLEGALPLSKEVWDNVSFGYQTDEKKIFNELKYGKGYGGGGFGGPAPFVPERYRIRISAGEIAKPTMKITKAKISPKLIKSKQIKPRVKIKRARI